MLPVKQMHQLLEDMDPDNVVLIGDVSVKQSASPQRAPIFLNLPGDGQFAHEF
jgi:hypothetical protein